MKRFYQKLNRQILMMYYLRFQMSWHLLKIWSQTYQYFWHMVCLNIANGKVRTPPRSTRSCFLLKTAIQFLKVLHSLCFNKINIFQVPHCHNVKKVTFLFCSVQRKHLKVFHPNFCSKSPRLRQRLVQRDAELRHARLLERRLQGRLRQRPFTFPTDGGRDVRVLHVVEQGQRRPVKGRCVTQRAGAS